MLLAATAVSVMATLSCDSRKFHVNGNITGAADSTLYLEHIGIETVTAVDSTTLSADGSFSFSGAAPSSPEFYRLRIAGQIVNIAIDSTETVTVKAVYPQMAQDYEVDGSEECKAIRQLSQMQMALQRQVNAIASDGTLNPAATADSIGRVIESHKERVSRDFIYAAPKRASSYFALFQTLHTTSGPVLIFNPRTSQKDIRAFAAVATSWDMLYPGSQRAENLHNIAIEGMKDVRIMQQNNNAVEIDASKVDTSGLIELSINDNRGTQRTLSSLKGKVVMLDFHAFAAEGSTERIMALREIYDKYHAMGFEIYQVSMDGNDHFWKTKTNALPWICVRDADGSQRAAQKYNVIDVPTFFLLDKNCNVYKRDVQIDDLDKEIQSLLAQ